MAMSYSKERGTDKFIELSFVDITCDNIHSWISLSGDLVIMMEFTVLNSPKGFWRSLQRSHFSFLSFVNHNHQDLIINPSVPFSFAFAWLNALQAAVRHSHSLSDPVLRLVTQANNQIAFFFNIYWASFEAIKRKRLNAMPALPKFLVLLAGTVWSDRSLKLANCVAQKRRE